eukprot:c8701_g1_i2.p1 GENE.c8701_g1_i2~~c8701_g1_i2.p1  ORF type:complete len:332 (+),score=56.26 c8701_g1_i2:158-1153(+)
MDTSAPLPSPSRRLSLTEPPLPVFNLPPHIQQKGEFATSKFCFSYACVSIPGTYLQFSNQQQSVAKYKTNQDSFFVAETLSGNTETHMMGVLDGHGQIGHLVSQHIATRFPKRVETEVEASPSEPLTSIFPRLFDKIETDLLSSDLNVRFSGTTCVVLHMQGSELVIANCGDSRCIVGSYENGTWSAKDLSNDHKPDLPEEKKRIEGMGGRVEPLRTWPEGPKRVWLRFQDLPGLAMSRSFGDSVAHSVGVTHEPEVTTHTLGTNDKVLILASDGVWEFISSSEAIEMVSSMPNALSAAEMLCQESVERWAREEPVCDDVTCIIVTISPIE